MKIYKFRNCLLNTAERSVLKENECLELTTRTFDVLQFLIEHAGEIVTKDELLGTVWNGNFVEESNLPVHISKLRRLLGETREGRYIETVQGVGYRFVAPVQIVDSSLWQINLPPTSGSIMGAKLNRRPFESIAVLPLDNQSNDPDLDYIADGLTESFISKLSLIPDLRVIARNTVFRYKGKDVPTKELGETLGIATALTGRIRIVGDDLIVSAELVNVADETQLWGKRFHRRFDDIVRVQEEISSAVAEKLRWNTKGFRDQMSYSVSQDPESYKVYLKGEYLLGKRTVVSIKKAIACFAKSIAKDPENIHSQIRMVDCYRLLYVIDSISRKAAIKKMKPFLVGLSEFGQSIDALQLMYGELSFQLDGDFDRAERHFREALNLNPNCLDANIRYAEILALTGRSGEAQAQINRVLEIDPFSLLTYKRVARVFYGVGCYDTALDYLYDALELEPTDYETLALIGGVYTELHDYREALAAFRKSLDAHPTVDVLAMVGYVEALRGQRDTAEQIIRDITSQSKLAAAYPLKLARIHLALGNREKTYDLLEKAFDEREVELCGLLYDPRWKHMKKESRFIDLAKRVEIRAKQNSPVE